MISVQKSQDNSKIKLQRKYKHHLTSTVLHTIHSLKIKINYFTFGHTCRKVSRSSCHIFNLQLASRDAVVLFQCALWTLKLATDRGPTRVQSMLHVNFVFFSFFSPFNLRSSDYNRTSIPKSHETNSTMFVGLI